MKYVMKFGGTSVKDAGYQRICDILSDYKKDKVVVVVSALKGITDKLLEATRKAEKGEENWIKNFLKEIREVHREVARNSIGTLPSWLNERLEKADVELEHVLHGILYLKEATARSLDYVASFGERYSVEIASATLVSKGFKSRPFTGGEAGVITNSRFGQATPLMELVRKKVSETILPLLKDNFIPVVGGFAGVTEDGIITTLGRGGSDYTATILANAIDADEVIIWSDVNGIMSADPKLVPESVTLPEITYDEAMEMAILGAKALHPRALEPVIEKKIPVRIKNTFNPQHEGTKIMDSVTRPYHSVVKVISLIRDICMITIKGASMVGEVGMAARFFNKIAEAKSNVMMISQSISESNISIVVKKENAKKVYEILTKEFGNEAKKLELEDDICAIACVGEGMKGTPGVAARMFKAVADAGVNVRMIAQGSSELNISFVVKEVDGLKALKALHKEFIEKVYS
ncbi:MAG: aspartate kinase [Nitrososphaeria archaeon]